MFVRQFKLGAMDNFAYLVVDDETKRAAVIDPSFDARRLQREAERRGIAIVYVLNTHGHPDHSADSERLARETGAEVAAHETSRIRKDVSLEDGRILKVGNLEVRVIHTPGHSPDGCCFLADRALFTGDTLFIGDCGRTDLPGSDVDEMRESLLDKIRSLPDDLVVYPGHDYGDEPFATLGHQKVRNRVLVPRTREEFRRFMGEP